MKKILSVFLLCILCVSFSGCGFKQGIVAKINKEEIPIEIFNYFYSNVSSTYPDPEIAKEKVFELITSYYIIKQLAIETGNDLTDVEKEKVEKSYTTIENAYGGEEKFAEKLAETNNVTPAAFKEVMYLFKYSEVTVDKLANSYTADELKKLDIKRIKHIQFLTKDENSGFALEGVDLEEALATADNVLQLAKEGNNFDTLIAQYSNDKSAAPNGYFITPNGDYAKELKDTANKLVVGQISDIVEVKSASYEAYEIIKRESLTDEEYATYDSEIRIAKFYDELQKKIDSAKIEKNDKAIAEIIAKTEE